MKIVNMIVICLVAFNTVAQGKANIEVSYTATSPNMKNGRIEVKNQYILLANTSESKFYSPMTEFIDSLNSSPGGVAIYQEMVRSAYFGGKITDIPRKDGNYYIMKYLPENKVSTYDISGLERFAYDEFLDDWNWEIGEATKDILGYECLDATTHFHGRK